MMAADEEERQGRIQHYLQHPSFTAMIGAQYVLYVENRPHENHGRQPDQYDTLLSQTAFIRQETPTLTLALEGTPRSDPVHDDGEEELDTDFRG